MKDKNLFDVFKRAFYDFYRNPIIIIPSLSMLLFFILFSSISVRINKNLNTTFLLTAWLLIFSAVSLLAISFFLSGLIGICFESSKKKARLIDLWHYSKTFYTRNFIIIAIIIIIYNIIRYIAHNFSMIIGKLFEMNVNAAQFLFFIFYFAGLAGILIFFSFANFYLIIEKGKIFMSIKKSYALVKKKYIETLSAIILFFALNQLLEIITNRIIFEAIDALIIVPYLAVVFTRFVIEFGK